jgi:TetR/AcrR family transcriptional repressor of bet genes
MSNKDRPDNPRRKRRAEPPEVRREQLVAATIKCIARNGLSATTMSEVTREAGLSQGIVNLHFESKEKLLIATLRYIAEEYNTGQRKILDSNHHASVADKIQALLDFDFSQKVTRKDKLAVWFAFWGEAKSRPTYQEICSASDTAAETQIRTLFQQAIDEGAYRGVNDQLLAQGYTALIDGLWLDLLIVPRRFTRKRAKQIATLYLATALPQHIQLPGDE